MANLIQRIVELERRVAEQDRRNRNRRRTGIIKEVDNKKGLARVQFSDKPKPYIGGWMPWKEIAAGKTSTHIPPVVGEQVDVTSESGDLTDGVIDFSTHSDQNPRPGEGADPVIKHGNVVFTITEEKVTIKGAVKIEGNVDFADGYVKHNGHSIGDDHKHKDVEPGLGTTGVPE